MIFPEKLVLAALSAVVISMVVVIVCVEPPPSESPPVLRSEFRPTSSGLMEIIHDDANGVTCWRHGNGLSCLPNGSFGGAR